jgi:hypothetical protein
MSNLTGLFTRGSTYYLKVVLPTGHPAKPKYRNGRMVPSLGACGKREAITTTARWKIKLPGAVPPEPFGWSQSRQEV